MRKLALLLGSGLLGGVAIPAISQPAIAATQRFRVEVRGTNADLLDRVRAFEPGAFVRSGEGVIQVGLFGEVSQANRLVDELELVGIPARLVVLGRKPKIPPTVAGDRFRVEVSGADRDLLDRVRAVEPEAFVRPGEGAIQAGLFNEADKANRLIRDLQRADIPAKLVVLGNAPATPTSSSVTSISPAEGQVLRVEVAGTDLELLDRVRTLEPGAFVRSSKGVIQAGQFEDAANAGQLVENLALLGVPAQVVTVDRPTAIAGQISPGVVPTSPDGTLPPGTELTFVPLELPTLTRPIAIDTPPPPAEATATLIPTTQLDRTLGGEFYVVVPGRQRRLPRIETKVRRRLNEPSIPVNLRNAPFGPHVAIGPFAQREEAEQWQEKLRSEGIKKARVEQQSR